MSDINNRFPLLKRKLTMFRYDNFFTMWILISLSIWICFGILSLLENNIFMDVERLFWWLWLVISLFIFQTRHSKLIFRHNMQVINAKFRERFDARINLALIEELIPFRKAQEKKKNNRLKKCKKRNL